MRTILFLFTILLTGCCDILDAQGFGCWFDSVSEMNAYTPNPDNGHCVRAFVTGTNEHYEWDGTQWVMSGGSTGSVNNSCYVYLSDAKTLDVAIAQSECIVVDTQIVLTASTVIPETHTIEFERTGKLTINTGVGLTIDGALEAEVFQIFDGDGSINGTTNTRTWYAEWFGAKTDDGIDDSPTIQKTLDAVTNIGGATVLFQKGNYYITTPCHVGSNTRLTGVGQRAAVFSLPTTTSACNPEPAPETSNIRRLPVFWLGDYYTAVDDVMIDNLKFECNDHLIGFANTPTNWVSTFAVLGQLEKDVANSEVFENITIENNTIRNSIVSMQLCLQGLGSRPPETYGYNVKNAIFRNNLIDGTSNKAVEFNSTDGALIEGNRCVRVQSGPQAIHFNRDVRMIGNYVEFEAEGLLMSNETFESIMSNNIAVWTGEGLKAPPYDSGGNQSVGISVKNDYTSNSTWGTWPRPHINEKITISGNRIDMTGAASGSVAFSFRTKSNSVLNTWRELIISDNVFKGAIRFLPFLDNNNSVINNILLSNNDIESFGLMDFSEITNVVVQGGILRNSFTVSGTNSWKFQGVNLEGGLTFASGSSNHYAIGCIGNITDNGTGNTIN